MITAPLEARVALLLCLSAACSTHVLSIEEQPLPTEFLVSDVHYTSDGGVVLTGTRTVLFFDRQLGSQRQVRIPPGADGFPRFSAVSANGEVGALAWTLGGEPTPVTVDLFRLDGTERSSLKTYAEVSGVALSPDGGRVAIAGRRASGEAAIDMFATDSGRALWTSDAIRAPFVFSPDGGRLYATVAADGVAFVAVSSASGAAGVEFPGYGGEVSVSPDGRHLATVQYDVTGIVETAVNVWRTSDGALERTVSEVANLPILDRVAAGPDGMWAGVVYGTNDPYQLQIWSRDGQLRCHQWVSNATHGYAIAFSPDGTEILAAAMSSDETITSLRVFRVSDGVEVAYHAVPPADVR